MRSDWQVVGLKCADKWLLPEDIQGQEAGPHHQAAHHCSTPSATTETTLQDQLNCKHYFSDSSHCDGGPASLMFGGDGSEYGEEEEEDYQYHNWGVDRVDLDFKSGHQLATPYKQETTQIFPSLSYPNILYMTETAFK